MARRVIAWSLLVLGFAVLGLAIQDGATEPYRARIAASEATTAIAIIVLGWYWRLGRPRVGVLLAGVAFVVWALLPALSPAASVHFDDQLFAVIGVVFLVGGSLHMAGYSTR
jgi:hypothetical protein